MKAARRIALLLATLLLALGASGGEPTPELAPIDPADPAWQRLAARLADLPDGRAEFTEARLFRFRSKPVQLVGIARVSARHGLSLEYTQPEARTVIVDGHGVLFREAGRNRAGPNDAQARAVNDAMLRLLRFDLKALAETFMLQGRIDDRGWRLALAPKVVGFHEGSELTIEAVGDATGVRNIDVVRAGRRLVAIRIQPPSPAPEGLSAEEIRQYFRGSP